MIQPIIAANWKMNKTIMEAVAFIEALRIEEHTFVDRTVIVAPPFTALARAREALQGSSIHLAAQNIAWAASGAYTGEVSAAMVSDAGCDHVIIGHSERRTLYGETDDQVHRKLSLALQKGLKPIFCVGETLQERESGSTLTVIERQIKDGLRNCPPGDIHGILMAYEPVWAIGTGKTATPDQACTIHLFIKNLVRECMGEGATGPVPVLYGGSVNESTINDLMAQEGIDGVLVGGASLQVETFLKLVRFQAPGKN